MANWAIVIGINEYWAPEASLRGAVADALKMTAWLTSQEGGNVPPRNLYLMTNPTPPPLTSPLPPGINIRNAEFDTLVQTAVDLVNKSGGKGERFFFYFAGHGLVNNHFGGESSLAFSDFSPASPHKSVTIPSVREYFGNTAFAEQFFFFDACRNRLDWRRPFKVSDFPFPGEEDPSRLQKVSQCVLSATSPLLRAVEMNEQGAFTEILLAGLAGASKAKIYDKDADEYVVRVDRLFAYVAEAVQKKEILVTAPPDPPLYQRVYAETRNVPTPPTLARIPRDAIEPVGLNLYIEPDGLWTQTQVKVRVTSEDFDYDEEIVPVTNVPVALPPVVLPKSYIVRAEAAGYQPEQRRWPIDLYEPQTRKLKLNPMVLTGGSSSGNVEVGGTAEPEVIVVAAPPVGAVPPSRPLPELAPDLLGEDTTRGVPGGGGFFRGIEVTAPTATLIAKSSDPLAPIEIYDNKGELKAEGLGEVVADDLEPGFYRARLVTPEGKMAEELVDLSSGEKETVTLDAPSLPNYGLFKEFIERTDFRASDANNTLHVTDEVGAMATPQLTTLLALAGSVVTYEYSGGAASADMGLPSFRELTSPYARCGLRVICADEATHVEGAGDYLSQVSLRFWRQGPSEAERPETEGLIPSRDFVGVGDFAREVEPAAYILELNVPERPPVLFSVAVLPYRLTLVVLHRRADGGIRILSFCPSTLPPTPDETPRDIATKLRRLELLQRFYLADRVHEPHALRNAVELLHAKWIDPLAGCLGGYMMLKLGQDNELEVAVNNMRRQYGELPDSHVLAAEFQLSLGTANGEALARRSYATALDLGLPVFVEGLLRLASGIERLGINHPRADEVRRVFTSRARNLLWTAWTIQEEAATASVG
ncbi:MAG TPA: caspase family protein [Pyrinomonadaceae bacterium]